MSKLSKAQEKRLEQYLFDTNLRFEMIHTQMRNVPIKVELVEEYKKIKKQSKQYLILEIARERKKMVGKLEKMKTKEACYLHGKNWRIKDCNVCHIHMERIKALDQAIEAIK